MRDIRAFIRQLEKDMDELDRTSKTGHESCELMLERIESLTFEEQAEYFRLTNHGIPSLATCA